MPFLTIFSYFEYQMSPKGAKSRRVYAYLVSNYCVLHYWLENSRLNYCFEMLWRHKIVKNGQKWLILVIFSYFEYQMSSEGAKRRPIYAYLVSNSCVVHYCIEKSRLNYCFAMLWRHKLPKMTQNGQKWHFFTIFSYFEYHMTPEVAKPRPIYAYFVSNYCVLHYWLENSRLNYCFEMLWRHKIVKNGQKWLILVIFSYFEYQMSSEGAKRRPIYAYLVSNSCVVHYCIEKSRLNYCFAMLWRHKLPKMTQNGQKWHFFTIFSYFEYHMTPEVAKPRPIYAYFVSNYCVLHYCLEKSRLNYWFEMLWRHKFAKNGQKLSFFTIFSYFKYHMSPKVQNIDLFMHM